MRLTDPEQIKAILHPLRQRILEQLEKVGAATPSEVARAIGIAASKAHYHVRILEKAGLLKLVETRQVGSVTETYFALVARHFEVNLKPQESPEQAAQALATVEREVRAVLKALHQKSVNPEARGDHPCFLAISNIGSGPHEQPLVDESICRLQDGLAKIRQEAPDRRYRMVVSLTPIEDDLEEED